MRIDLSPSLFVALTVLIVVLAASPSLAAGAACLCMAACLWAVAMALRPFAPWPGLLRLLFCVALGLTLGCFFHLRLTARKAAVYAGIPTDSVDRIYGTVTQDSVVTRTGGMMHRVMLSAVAAGGGAVRVAARGKTYLFERGSAHYATGEIISGRAELRLVERPEEIVFSGSAISTQSHGFVAPYWEFRAELNDGIRRRIDTMGFPASALFEALLLGTRDRLPAEMIEGFAGTGTIHLLALSGLHVGIVYVLVIVVLLPLPGRFAKWLGYSLFVLFYVFLVGPRPSLVRASLMLVLAGFSKLADRDTRPINILSLALIASLLADPGSAYTLSFKLSFLAMSGILLIGRGLSRRLQPTLPAIIRTPVCYSIGAQLATLPLVLSEFGLYYPSGILANILLVPLVSFYIWAGLILLALFSLPVSGLDAAGAALMRVLYRAMAVITKTLSSIPALPAVPLVWAVLIGAAGLLIWVAVRGYSRSGRSVEL